MKQRMRRTRAGQCIPLTALPLLCLIALAGIAPAAAVCTDADTDGVFAEPGCGAWVDCDDHNAAVSPLVAENCNGIDDDCDGFLDEGICAAAALPESQSFTPTYPYPTTVESADDEPDLDLLWGPGGYAIAWKYLYATTGSAEEGIALTLLNPFGQPTQAKVVLQGGIRSFYGQVSLAEGRDRYLVVWCESSVLVSPPEASYAVTYALITRSGQRVTGNRRLTDGLYPARHPRVVYTGQDFGMLWVEQTTNSPVSYSLLFATVDLAGNLVSSPVTVASGVDPAAAWLYWLGDRFVAIWRQDMPVGTTTLVLSSWARDGASIIPPTAVVSYPSEGSSNRVPPVWTGTDFFALFGSDENSRMYTFTRDGLLISQAQGISGIVAPADPPYTHYLRVQVDDLAWDGHHLLLAWTGIYRSPEDSNLRYRILISTINREGEVGTTNILYSYNANLGNPPTTDEARIAWNGRGVGIAHTHPYSDALGFGTSGCIDYEESDGIDNDCNGLVDDGFDTDEDGIDNSVDSCPGTLNPEQSDLDGDHRGDVCDCDPLSPNAWTAVGPVPAVEMASATGELVTWQDQGRDVTYDAFMGTLSALRGSGDVASSGCEVTPIASPYLYHDLPDPPEGDGQFFVVRSRNACGASSYEHGAGLDSSIPGACP